MLQPDPDQGVSSIPSHSRGHDAMEKLNEQNMEHMGGIVARNRPRFSDSDSLAPRCAWMFYSPTNFHFVHLDEKLTYHRVIAVISALTQSRAGYACRGFGCAAILPRRGCNAVQYVSQDSKEKLGQCVVGRDTGASGSSQGQSIRYCTYTVSTNYDITMGHPIYELWESAKGV
ncbi:hypothetical protein BJV74DRAFT_270548 [Russula compacta]|nr:hypothetical protein BJV74DRAFT_270548 [Russula compacta]